MPAHRVMPLNSTWTEGTSGLRSHSQTVPQVQQVWAVPFHLGSAAWCGSACSLPASCLLPATRPDQFMTLRQAACSNCNMAPVRPAASMMLGEACMTQSLSCPSRVQSTDWLRACRGQHVALSIAKALQCLHSREQVVLHLDLKSQVPPHQQASRCAVRRPHAVMHARQLGRQAADIVLVLSAAWCIQCLQGSIPHPVHHV